MPDKRASERWAVLSGLDIGADGDPYLDRLRIVQTPLFGIYLHHIHRPDREPDPHDHPWWFASLVLTGEYAEFVLPDKRCHRRTITRRRRRWSLRCLSRRSAHKVYHVSGPLWTLVVTGPKRGDWGFWNGPRFIPWRDYLNATEFADQESYWRAQ